MAKFSFRPVKEPEIKDGRKDYLKAQVNKTTRNQKINAGRGAKWAQDEATKDEPMDVHQFIQLVMETCHNAKRAGNLTDEAISAISFLAVQCQEAYDEGADVLGDALLTELNEFYANVRLGGSITEAEEGPEFVLPPPELSPYYNSFGKRQPSRLSPQPEPPSVE